MKKKNVLHIRISLIIFIVFLINSSLPPSISAESITDRFFVKNNYESSPLFIEKSDPLSIDDGKKIIIGDPTNADIPGVYFYNLETKEREFFAPPVRDFFQANPKFLQSGSNSPKIDPFPYFINKVLYYSSTLGKAGLLIENGSHQLPKKKFIFISVDLNSNSIEFAEEIFEIIDSKSDEFLTALYVGDGKFAVAIGNIKVKSSFSVSIYDYENSNLSLRFNYKSSLLPTQALFNGATNQLFLLTYAEAFEKLNPTGKFFDLSKNVSWEAPIPSVAYSFCFSPDNKHIFLASADTGDFRKLDVATGKEVQKAKVGTLGHAMGFWKEKELIWVRNSGIQIINPVTMKVTSTIPTKKYFKGLVNVSGSQVIPLKSLVLRNILGNSDNGTEFLHILP